MVMVNSCQLLVDRKKSFEFREGFRFLVSGFRFPVSGFWFSVSSFGFPEKNIALNGAGLRARFTEQRSNGGHGPPYKTNFPETGNWKPETFLLLAMTCRSPTNHENVVREP